MFLTTMTSADWAQQVGSAMMIFIAITVGIGNISLIVGGLSVINTMAMTVSERTREIGIKRAVGGSRRRIVRELVAESGLIGVIGGLIGLALTAIGIVLANAAGRSSATVLFDLTANTAVFAIALNMTRRTTGIYRNQASSSSCRHLSTGRRYPARIQR